MEKDYQEAFYEINEIFKTLPKDILEKIPKSFQKIIEDNKSTTYKKNINGLNYLDNLKIETIVILGLIYRDFLVDENEHRKLIEKEKNAIKELYSYDNLFKNTKKTNIVNEKNEQDTYLIVKNENCFTKILNFFKKLRGNLNA